MEWTAQGSDGIAIPGNIQEMTAHGTSCNALCDVVVFGQSLDLIILEIFSNFIDSMIYLLLLKELISVKLLKSALPALLLKARFSMIFSIFQFFNLPHSFSCARSGKKIHLCPL